MIIIMSRVLTFRVDIHYRLLHHGRHRHLATITPKTPNKPLNIPKYTLTTTHTASASILPAPGGGRMSLRGVFLDISLRFSPCFHVFSACGPTRKSVRGHYTESKYKVTFYSPPEISNIPSKITNYTSKTTFPGLLPCQQGGWGRWGGHFNVFTRS